MVMKHHPNHMIGLYFPIFERTCPEMTESAALPNEYGNILHKHNLVLVKQRECATYRTPAPVADDPNTWKNNGR